MNSYGFSRAKPGQKVPKLRFIHSFLCADFRQAGKERFHLRRFPTRLVGGETAAGFRDLVLIGNIHASQYSAASSRNSTVPFAAASTRFGRPSEQSLAWDTSFLVVYLRRAVTVNTLVADPCKPNRLYQLSR